MSVHLPVCVLVTTVSPAKTAEPIEMPFGMGKLAWAQQTIIRLRYGRHLANTMERQRCRGQGVVATVTV